MEGRCGHGVELRRGGSRGARQAAPTTSVKGNGALAEQRWMLGELRRWPTSQLKGGRAQENEGSRGWLDNQSLKKRAQTAPRCAA
jgi:hypothetical protein